MKVEQLLLQPHGQKIGGFTLTVKTCKKAWQVGEIWWHQVLFMDETGEIPADVKINGYRPLHRAWDVKIVVAEVRDAEYLGKPRKILVVDQYIVPSQPVEDYLEEADAAYQGEIKTIRSKIKCLLTASKIRQSKKETAHEVLNDTLDFVENDRLDKIVDKIMEG